jgi:hypothetical protein
MIYFVVIELESRFAQKDVLQRQTNLVNAAELLS